MDDANRERVTRIGEAMLDGLASSPMLTPDVKVLILIHHGQGGGLASYGYDGETSSDAIIAELVYALRKLLQGRGQDFLLVKENDLFGGSPN